jgi:hypothetical protein
LCNYGTFQSGGGKKKESYAIGNANINTSNFKNPFGNPFGKMKKRMKPIKHPYKKIPSKLCFVTTANVVGKFKGVV